MKKNVYELTKPQLSIYMSEKIINVPINNVIGTMYFPSTVNINLLIQAVNITVKNNQALRTIIFEKSGKPFQYFEDFFPFSFLESAVPKAAPDCAKLFARELTRSVVQPVDAIC